MILAQVQIHNRAGDDSCVANNGLCPDWIWDNFDRYVDPFFQHVLLTVGAVAVGFLTPFPICSPRRRSTARWWTSAAPSPVCSPSRS